MRGKPNFIEKHLLFTLSVTQENFVKNFYQKKISSAHPWGSFWCVSGKKKINNQCFKKIKKTKTIKMTLNL